jgi:putative flippase GtrA
MKENIHFLLDIFYPLFKRFMPLETFRYAACGGINTLMGLAIFYVSIHWIFPDAVVNLGFYTVESYSAALILSGITSFCLGFVLNKFIVFTGSNLKGRIQLFRYFLSFTFNLFLNYILLKSLVELLHVEAFTAQLLTTIVVITASYFSQKHFSFKAKVQ